MREALVTYSGYVLAVLGFIFGLIQLRLRKSAEIEKLELEQAFQDASTQKERRFNTYKEYLSKLDSINSKVASNLTGEAMKGEFQKLMVAIFENPDDETALPKYMEKANEFTSEWAREQSKALEELNGLRLICSEPILDLLEEYETTAKNYLSQSLDFLQRVDLTQPGFFESGALEEYKATYEHLLQIKKTIEYQMRIDIGADKA